MLSKRDEEIIQTIFTYRGLTAEQVTRLLFSPGSLTYVRVKLMELDKHKFLSRFKVPTTIGVKPYIYTPGVRGMAHLASIGIDTSGFTPLAVKGKEPAYYFLNHLHHLNDFLIAASLLPALTPDVELQEMLHDWVLKEQPVTSGKNSAVPDGWLLFKILVGAEKKPFQMPVWCEVDNKTEWGRNLDTKLRNIVQLIINRAHEQRFGVDNITVAFVTAGNEGRRDLLRKAMYSALKDLDCLQYSELFLFACLPENLDPQTIFLSPIFYLCHDNNPLPLLDLNE